MLATLRRVVPARLLLPGKGLPTLWHTRTQPPHPFLAARCSWLGRGAPGLDAGSRNLELRAETRPRPARGRAPNRMGCTERLARMKPVPSRGLDGSPATRAHPAGPAPQQVHISITAEFNIRHYSDASPHAVWMRYSPAWGYKPGVASITLTV